MRRHYTISRSEFEGVIAVADPRAAALEVLGRVLRKRRPLDEALDANQDLDAMEPRDRALARAVAATTLRRLGQIDALIDHCLDRPLPKKAWPTHDVLRIGVGQLLFLGVAPHAAVSTTVDLASPHHKKMVNAVLRRLGREGAGLIERQDAARMNTPDWLWDGWIGAHGAETARAIAEAHLSEAPLDIMPKADPDLWAARLEAEILPTGVLRRAAGGAVTGLPGFDEGAWWVQDAAAALPVRLLGDVAGKRVADLCAAPGGKTAQLAAHGARVTAVERSEARTERLRANLDRLGLEAELVVADAADWTGGEAFDAVLLDAPCSATGTIRRHPDVARLKSPDDISKLAAAQARLLAHAATLVRPGGFLVYCVCSLQPEEGAGVVESALAAGAQLRRIPVDSADAGGLAECVSPLGDLGTLPCHLGQRGGMDGFFAARLQRT